MRGALYIIAVTLLMCFGSGVVGCSAPLVEYRPGHAEIIRPAPADGYFTLRSESDYVESTFLRAGEPIGFARQGNQLLAVKGEQTLPLCSGSYAWLVETAAKPHHPMLLPVVNGPQAFQSNDPGAAYLLGYDLFAAAWDALVLHDNR